MSTVDVGRSVSGREKSVPENTGNAATTPRRLVAYQPNATRPNRVGHDFEIRSERQRKKYNNKNVTRPRNNGLMYVSRRKSRSRPRKSIDSITVVFYRRRYARERDDPVRRRIRIMIAYGPQGLVYLRTSVKRSGVVRVWQGRGLLTNKSRTLIFEIARFS